VIARAPVSLNRSTVPPFRRPARAGGNGDTRDARRTGG